MKKSSRLLLVEKCKLKSQWDITSHMIEWLLSKKSKNNTFWERCGKKGTFYIVGKNVNWCNSYRKPY
jgi:hypothetical protein